MAGVGRESLTEALRDVGLAPGAVVVVHSALRSFGRVEGGEDAVIDALLSAAGPAGTVCMPTLTYGDYGPRRPPPPFDPRTTPGVVGRIPERFRQRDRVERSLHPTHSVAAVGPQASALLRDHHRSATPCGPDSPWGRIAAAHGSVLLLGVGTHSCTLFHGAEEEAEPELRCGPPTPCRLVTDAGEETSGCACTGRTAAPCRIAPRCSRCSSVRASFAAGAPGTRPCS